MNIIVINGFGLLIWIILGIFNLSQKNVCYTLEESQKLDREWKFQYALACAMVCLKLIQDIFIL